MAAFRGKVQYITIGLSRSNAGLVRLPIITDTYVPIARSRTHGWLIRH
jgi:hypothetical protein